MTSVVNISTINAPRRTAARSHISRLTLNRPGRHRVVASRRADPRVFCALGSSKVAVELSEGKRLYDDGLRQRALNTFQKALDKETPTPEEEQALLYNIMCCHAAFGDYETAQMYLRSGLNAGLDYDAALQDPELITLESSKQVRLQLKKYAEAIAAQLARAKLESAFPPPPSTPKSNIDPLVEIEGKDDLDMSIPAIAKRVATVIAVAAVGFGVVFFAGLQFLR